MQSCKCNFLQTCKLVHSHFLLCNFILLFFLDVIVNNIKNTLQYNCIFDISAFGYLLAGLQLDLSQYAMDIVKPLGG